MKRLLLAIPTYGNWEPDFGISLALLMADLARREDIASVRVTQCEATIIADGRRDLARDAIEHGASHILWLDTDMRHRPAANAGPLLDHDLDVVGCTYPKRRAPHDMTAQDMEGNRIWPGNGPLIEASHIGFGLVLTRTSVFERVPEPWFATPWLENDRRSLGEDVFFCHHARAHGVKTFVDPKASIGVGHVSKKVLQGSPELRTVEWR